MSTTKRPLLLLLLANVLFCSWSRRAGCSLLRLKLDRLTSADGPTATTYLVHVDVGTPRRAFRLLVDVNAREVWLKRAGPDSAQAAGESLTSVSDHDDQHEAGDEQTYVVEYEQFRLTGRIRADYFQFSNVAASASRPMFKQRYLAVQSLEAAAGAPPPPDSDNFRSQVDGVLALNTYPVSDLGSDLVTVGLSRAKLTRELKFSLLFNANASADGRGLDELAFGGEQPDYFVGDSLLYHKVESQFRWQVNLSGVLLGARPVSSCGELADCKATISTVTDFIRGPADEVRALLAHFGPREANEQANATHFQPIDCSRELDAPKLTFVIDDVMYAIPPASYIRRRAAIAGGSVGSEPAKCYLALAPNVAAPASHWQLGTNFLENYYTVFDVNKRQVAFGGRVAA